MSAHRFWRLELANANRNAFVAAAREVDFRSAGDASLIGSGTAIGSSGVPASAFDGAGGTVWTSSSAAFSWIGYDFGSPAAVASARWTPDADYAAGLAAAAWIEWSDDGISWRVTDAPLDLTSATAGTPISRSVGADVAARLNPTENWRLTTAWPTGSSSGRVAQIPVRLNQLWGGKYRIADVVVIAGSPDYPVRRRVRCYDKDSGQLVGQTWSDAVTGAYGFTGLSDKRFYITMAEDYQAVYDAVVDDLLLAHE